MATKAERRTKGDGSIFQRCEARYGCPALVDVTLDDGTTAKARPEHSCSGRWFGVVDLTTAGGGRKRRTVSAKTKAEVRIKFRQLQKRTEAGATGDGTQTVAKWLTYWLDEISDARESTKNTYRGYVNNWVVPELGRVRLLDLSPEHVRGMLAKMERAGKSPATRKQVLSILSKALDVAHREGKVDRNVCATVTRPSLAQQGTHAHLTLDQVKTLLPHVHAHPNAARWLTALVLGIRQGEALGLAWEDVHLDDAEPWMHIHRAQARDGSIGPVKSKSGNRQIPIIEPVLTALRAHRDASGGEGLVWGPRKNRADYNEWHALLAKASLPKVPVHGARATAASILDAMGATPRQVADILGHSTVRVAQQHYVHSDRADLRAALTRSGEAFALPAAD